MVLSLAMGAAPLKVTLSIPLREGAGKGKAEMGWRGPRGPIMACDMSDIASVSLSRPLAEFSRELGRSFEEFGFAIVRDHGIPADLVARADVESRAFFAL